MTRAELRWPGRTAQAALSAGVPSAPSSVTSITKDAGATVSFYAPVSSGSGGPITQYVVTPYIAGTPQSATTIAAGSVGTLLNSSGATALQIPVAGLTNATAYTFSVRARNAAGDGAESGQSGANTPLSGLVFGDDFNGPASGPIDPEWWVYNRSGYLAQNEIEYYLPSQVALDGSSNLTLTGVHSSYTGPSYAGGNVTQPWRSGACQSNVRSYAPSADINTMTFESRFQICPGIAGGMWPGLFWLEGSFYLTQWKTDPTQGGWNATGQAEIDIAEFGSPGQSGVSATSFLSNLNGGSGFLPGTVYSPGPDFSAAMHVFSAAWKGTSAQSTRTVKTYVDAPYVAGTGPSGGTLLSSLSNTADIPVRTANPFFLLLYLQIVAGSATSPQVCSVDYVRIYDQNLG